MADRGLGTLTLSLITKTGGFTGPLDQAARSLDKRSSEMQKRATQLGKDIGIGLSAAFGIAATGIGVYIKNTVLAEKVQAQLASRIKDTGGAAGQSLKSLNDAADALQALTTFDDESIGGVQAMLLTFKDIKGDNFRAATEAVLDLSTAMGTDLNGAALQVGKALQDPVKGISALSRAGVQFTEDQKKVIKSLVETGDKAGAQKIILDELAGQMGTAAEAARNTLGGALQGLKNTFDNLLEGDSGSEGMKGAVQAVNDLNTSLNDPGVKQGIDSLANGLLAVANGAVQGAAKLGSFISEYKDFLANHGFAEGKTLDQLEIRRDKLLESKKTPIGMFSEGSIDKEITRIDNLIESMKQAAKWGNVLSGSSTSEIAKAGSSGGGGGGGGTSGGSRSHQPKAKALPDFRDEDMSALLDQIQVVGQADEQFKRLAATLSGPLAEAELDHTQALKEINDLGIASGKTTAEINDLKAKETERYDAQTAAIQKQQSPYDEVNTAIQEQIKLLGMSSEQQEIYNNLKAAGVDANTAYGQSIVENTEKLQAARESADFYNDAQREGSDALADWITGTKSAKEAFGDFADSLYKRAIQFLTDKAIQSLFDAFSSSGTATAFGNSSAGGSAWSGLEGLGAAIGGGYSDGGYTGPGSKKKIAGLVHAGEYVISAENVRKLGVGFLDNLSSRAWIGEDDFEPAVIRVSAHIPQRPRRACLL